MACILLWSSAVRVHDLHAYRKMVVTRERISHPRKVMLKIILRRLKPKAEKIIAEEQAGFRAGRNTQSRSSTYAFYVRNISGTSKTSTMSS